MKKTVSTLTAVVFALGLATAGLAQTTAGKEAEKPATKMETPASQTQAAPVEKASPKLATGGEKQVKPETKKEKKGKKGAQVKKGQKAADKPEHPAASTEKPKQETK